MELFKSFGKVTIANFDLHKLLAKANEFIIQKSD